MKKLVLAFVCAILMAVGISAKAFDACSDAGAEENWASDGFSTAYSDYNMWFDALAMGLNTQDPSWAAGTQNYNDAQSAIASDQNEMTYMSNIITEDEQVKKDNGCPAH